MTVLITCPLGWPKGIARTPSGIARPPCFNVPLSDSFEALKDALFNINAADALISTNIELTKGGKPRQSGAMAYPDPGVSIFFRLNGETVLLQCDRFERVADNLMALVRYIDGCRVLVALGVSKTVDDMFRGSQPRNKRRVKSWREVLEFDDPAFPLTKALVRTRYLELFRSAPNDHKKEIGDAFESAMQEMT